MIQSLGRSQDKPVPEPFRIIGHPVVLAIIPFIFLSKKVGHSPKPTPINPPCHNTPLPVYNHRTGPRSPTGLLRTKHQTHPAYSGKMLLPEAALNEPSLAGGLLNRETRPSAIPAR